MTCQRSHRGWVQTFIFLIQMCALPTLRAVSLSEETAKSLAGEHKAGGVYRTGRPSCECRSLPPPLVLGRIWERGAPFTKPQQCVSEVLQVSHLVSQRLGDKVPCRSKVLGAWMETQLQLMLFSSPTGRPHGRRAPARAGPLHAPGEDQEEL